MLRIGLTGGIASGKSLVAARLRDHGAVVIDADALAREVVEPGTDGLARIIDAFGTTILADDGSLDRPALGAEVFDHPERLETLNGIVHPLVRGRSRQLEAEAGDEAIVVHDIPLLVETGQASSFHLVVVVDAPENTRMQRMMRHRAMTRHQARSRIAAQAGPAERRAVADVVIDNVGSRDATSDVVDRLWQDRLVPFDANLRDGHAAERQGPPVMCDHDPGWSTTAERLTARIAAAAPELIRTVDHIGSTAVPGLPAKDVIDLQVGVESLADADHLAIALGRAGYPRKPGLWQDTPKPNEPDPAAWQKRLHASADPGRPVNVHVRTVGSPGWRYALAFRDWLRADPATRDDYAALKRRLAAEHSDDATTSNYADAKEPWFSDAADEPLRRWILETGWTPPQGPPGSDTP